MSSDTDLVTFGLCVHAANHRSGTKQLLHHFNLKSPFFFHTYRLRYLKFYLCSVTQIHNYTLSGNRYDVTDTNFATRFDFKSSGFHDFIIYSYKIHFNITISDHSRFLDAFA